jgi:hypothetical protein
MKLWILLPLPEFDAHFGCDCLLNGECGLIVGNQESGW